MEEASGRRVRPVCTDKHVNAHVICTGTQDLYSLCFCCRDEAIWRKVVGGLVVPEG